MHFEKPLQKKQQHTILLQCLDKEGADEPHTERDLQRDGAITNSFSEHDEKECENHYKR